MVRPNIKKKILNEINEINDNAQHLGIYAFINGEEIDSLKVLIIGPEDSPYYGGFFLFKVTFPEQFPFLPPHVKFITPNRYNGCRVHPNLYQDGKVCLSILNTWGGKEWSPVLTLEKIFLTIQGLLDNNPVANEPNQEHVKKDSLAGRGYYLVALYRTLTVGVLSMFSHPELPPPFLSLMRGFVRDKAKNYLDQADQLQDKEGQNIKCFHGNETIAYSKLKNDLLHLVHSCQ